MIFPKREVPYFRDDGEERPARKGRKKDFWWVRRRAKSAGVPLSVDRLFDPRKVRYPKKAGAGEMQVFEIMALLSY